MSKTQRRYFSGIAIALLALGLSACTQNFQPAVKESSQPPAKDLPFVETRFMNLDGTTKLVAISIVNSLKAALYLGGNSMN